MPIDNNPLTDLIVAQFRHLWADFLSLFNSEYALLYFGIGSILMGVTAQYNSRISKFADARIKEMYQFAKVIALGISLLGILAVTGYVMMDARTAQTFIHNLSQYPLTIYVFLICVATSLFGLAVNWLNRPYPSLKNNVAGLSINLGFIYFLFEVQDIEVAEPGDIIMIVMALAVLIYFFGDFSVDKEEYLKRELKKTDDRRRLIVKKMEALEKEKQKKARKRRRALRDDQPSTERLEEIRTRPRQQQAEDASRPLEEQEY